MSGPYIQYPCPNWAKTSHTYSVWWDGVSCIRMITLAQLFFKLLPFVIFNSVCLSGAYLLHPYPNWAETSHTYSVWWDGVSYTRMITLAQFLFELLPFVIFNLVFCPEHISYNHAPIELKLQILTQCDETTCHAQEW